MDDVDGERDIDRVTRKYVRREKIEMIDCALKSQHPETALHVRLGGHGWSDGRTDINSEA
jgi:hypothetical protein